MAGCYIMDWVDVSLMGKERGEDRGEDRGRRALGLNCIQGGIRGESRGDAVHGTVA